MIAILRVLYRSSPRIGPRQHIIFNLVQNLFKSLINRLNIVLNLQKRVFPALLRPWHRLTLLTIRPDEVHGLINCIENGLIVYVVGL